MKPNTIIEETPKNNSLEIEYKYNEVLEVTETEELFKPHFGRSFVFYFNNGYPQLTIGPHCNIINLIFFCLGPLSLCLLCGILGSTYFITVNIAS